MLRVPTSYVMAYDSNNRKLTLNNVGKQARAHIMKSFIYLQQITLQCYRYNKVLHKYRLFVTQIVQNNSIHKY